MQRDDYFVIVYQILSYLYDRLKAGEPTDPNMLLPQNEMFQINDKYWAYIIASLYDQCLISTVGGLYPLERNVDYLKEFVMQLGQYLEISTEGIDYLHTSTRMQQARAFLHYEKVSSPFDVEKE